MAAQKLTEKPIGSNPSANTNFVVTQPETVDGITKESVRRLKRNQVIDDTLSTAGMAADAKAVGDEIGVLKADLNATNNTLDAVDDAVTVLANPQTITGDSVTFSTEEEESLKIECEIIPNQSGSGNPSPTNIRQINQIDNIVISQSGATTKSVTVTFPTEAGAVYGGELTINKDGSADFVANTKLYTLTGNEAWTYTGSAASRRIYYFRIGAAFYTESGGKSSLTKCSHFPTTVLYATGTDAGYAVDNNASTQPKGTQIRIRCGLINDAYIDTVDSFKAWLAAQNSAGTPVQCTVELKEVVTYHFTAEAFKSAIGENTFSQNNGTISVTYNKYYAGLTLNDTQKTEVKTIAVDRIPWEYGIDKVLCIGDSLTFGSPADGTTMPYPIEQNYPHYLSRFLGCECTNGGTPNYSAKSWYNNNFNSYDMTQYNAFIIFLGTNGGVEDTLATDVDPYTDYNDFADTQAGCYCKIIRRIQTERPNAPIILVNTWHVAVGQPETRETIKKIGTKYGLPVVNTYSVMRYAVNPVYHGNVDDVHCSKAGYLALANLIRVGLYDWITEHPDFVNLGMSKGSTN